MFIIPLLTVCRHEGVRHCSASWTHEGTATTDGAPCAPNGHMSSTPPPHGHTMHTHGCDHHGHLHRHLHGHGCDRDNGNASLTTPALAHPHPPMGTLVAARHACKLMPSVGPSRRDG